jgi:Leucine-rich repeat (LRR) protein
MLSWNTSNVLVLIELVMQGSNNLVGAIPEEIGMLTDLIYFSVGDNRLASTIPAGLFEISTLKGVDLHTNSFSGVLPSTFEEATSLEILHLGSNKLSGPVSLDHLVDNDLCPLQFVVLTGNTFSGTFPLESIAANCTEVFGININHSGLKINGGIPSFGLEKLTTLDVAKTELGGSIPDEISRLWRLQQFRADFNALTGTIPASLGEMKSLTELSLSNNYLSGTLPSTLESCTNLAQVKLEINSLSGDIDFLCALELQQLTSDCNTGDVVCTCCNFCF